MHYVRQKKTGTTRQRPPHRTKQCRAPKCKRPAKAKQLCQLHYRRQKAFDSYDLPSAPTCAVASCTRKALVHRVCGMHWHRIETNGRIDKRVPQCLAADCNEPQACSTFCNFHYYRRVKSTRSPVGISYHTSPEDSASHWDALIEGMVLSHRPGLFETDWEALFKADPAILGHLVRDLAMVGISSSTPGQRAASEQEIRDELSQISALKGLALR